MTMANSYQERFLKLSVKVVPKWKRKLSPNGVCVCVSTLLAYIYMKNVVTAYPVAVIIVPQNTSRLYNVQT